MLLKFQSRPYTKVLDTVSKNLVGVQYAVRGAVPQRGA